jgi:hypothetical protein
MKNIALLIPVCSRNKQYNILYDTPIMKCIYPSFLNTKNEEYNYSFFIGFDDDDEFYKSQYDELKKIFKNVHILSECQHAPAFAWNKLAMVAYNSTDVKYDYFFQVGDDIILETPNWSKIFIEKLTLHNDIGVVGPCNLSNYNGRILEGKPYVIENSFVSRKHIDIFNYFFHPTIKNWYCDDWITEIYKPFFSEIQTNILCVNSIWNRYIIHGCDNISILINESQEIIFLYIKNTLLRSNRK